MPGRSCGKFQKASRYRSRETGRSGHRVSEWATYGRGRLGDKGVAEQLVEEDAARTGKHFGTHPDRHDYAKREFPGHVNVAMKRVWFAYGDLGYDGVNGKRAKEIVVNLNKVLEFFEGRFGEKIEPKAKP